LSEGENPKSIVETIIATYPIMKDVIEKLGVRKLKAQDLLLLATVQNTQFLADDAKVLSSIEALIKGNSQALANNTKSLSGIEASIKGINEELHRLREDLKPILEAVAELIKAEAERRRAQYT
jgi:septal ring factor EnvC (AmiA/AmiB activator)